MKYESDLIYINEEYTLEKGDTFSIKKVDKNSLEICVNDKKIKYVTDIKILEHTIHIQRIINTSDIKQLADKLL